MAARGPKPIPLEIRFWAKVAVAGPGDCWPWTAAADQHGYGQIGYGGGNSHVKAHRAAWFLATGDWPRLHVLHRCDNPACVNIKHLFLGTQMDNHDDMKAKRRGNIGERHGHRRLTEREVRYILSKPKTGYRMAKDLGVSLSAVYDILKRRTWRHVAEV